MATIIVLDISEQEPLAQLTALTALITPEKRRKIKAFKQEADALRTLYGELLVRNTASKILGVEHESLRIVTNEFGKPYLLDYPNFQYNLSHSGCYIAMICGKNPVGIDIEKHKEVDVLSLASLCMTPAEQNTLRALFGPAQMQYFYDIWTLKESYVKAVGKGLSLPLESFEVRVSEERMLPRVRLRGTVAAECGAADEHHGRSPYHLRTYEWEEPGYTLSACSAAEDLPYEIIHCKPHDLDLVRHALGLNSL